MRVKKILIRCVVFVHNPCCGYLGVHCYVQTYSKHPNDYTGHGFSQDTIRPPSAVENFFHHGARFGARLQLLGATWAHLMPFLLE